MPIRLPPTSLVGILNDRGIDGSSHIVFNSDRDYLQMEYLERPIKCGSLVPSQSSLLFWYMGNYGDFLDSEQQIEKEVVSSKYFVDCHAVICRGWSCTFERAFLRELGPLDD